MTKLPSRAKRTQRIGAAPDARTPMLLDLSTRIAAMQVLERLASSTAYLALANIAHGINSYTDKASISVDDYSDPTLAFYLYQGDLNRWSDIKYCEAVNALQFAVPDHTPERKDSESKENLSRCHIWQWRFETGDAAHPVAVLKVQLDAYESKDTAECRRVQVGTKTTEVPIYRYDCVAPEGNAGELPAPVIDANALDIL